MRNRFFSSHIVLRLTQAAYIAALALLFGGGAVRYVCLGLGVIFLVGAALVEGRTLAMRREQGVAYHTVRFVSLMAIALYAVVYMFLVLGEAGIGDERIILFGAAILWAADGAIPWNRQRAVRSLAGCIVAVLFIGLGIELFVGAHNSLTQYRALYGCQLLGSGARGTIDPWFGVPGDELGPELYLHWMSGMGPIFAPSRRSGPLRTNELGMRDVKSVRGKGNDEIRVLCLGASTTAQGVDSERTYPAYLEKELNKLDLPAHVTVWNGGVPGWTLKTSLVHYITRYSSLNPDIVVVYHGANDLRSSRLQTWPYDKRKEVLSRGVPLVAAAKYGITSSELGRIFIPWLEQLLASRGRVSRGQGAKGPSAGPRNEFDTSPYFRGFREAARVLATTAKERGAVTVFVGFETALGGDDGYTDEERGKLERYLGAYSAGRDAATALEHLGRMNESLRALHDGENVFYVDSGHFIPKTAEYYYDVCHRTDRGRRIFAEMLASALKEKVIDVVQAKNSAR